MVATLSGKSGKKKTRENGGFGKKVMKSQDIWYKNAVTKKVYHH